MTKSTITREQLLEIIETDHVQCGEASYLASMALAAMDSEPVAWLRNPDQGFHLPMLRLGSKDPNPNFVNEEFYPVYAAPQPEPVVPDENTLRIQGIEALEEFLTATTVEPEMLGGIKLTLACCRALKAIIKNKGWADFNDGKPEKVKAETIITALREPHPDACRAAMLHAGNSPAKNGVAPAQSGNSPVIPDGWIPVSERMPEIGDIVLTAMGGVVNVGEMECSAANYRFFTSVISGSELPATHWMPLPSAPKEGKP
ncbi:hypothetical protein KP591P3_00068 [Klebsiella phage KP591P3]|uniref:hypothetical protein n=1 Tax=Klebsiella phage KP591P1 TaxID=2968665 RepID=UPI00233F1C77|nr:hypothetical protein PRB84_gp23 [Klebsiella phage KP591P1]YP_010685481.1 hypothetical protein PRB85_gp50 [Klebsiella phage KP591P3]WAX16304.1 hypothetical protein KP591P1_00023 [Klebsiella phage KP591P1]WAX16424.1 hypothetical protein KP591P3_00068 [Klebsiella phage KP591P3]